MTRQYDNIIFDLGNVLFHWDASIVTALPKQTIRAMMNTTIWLDYECGFISPAQAHKLLATEMNTTPELVAQSLGQAQLTLRPDAEMTELLLKLGTARTRPGQAKVCILGLSNIARDHFAGIRKIQFPWHLFDHIFTSCDTGMRKPDLCIYQHLIKETGIDPTRTIFLDDRVDNIFTARSLGLRGEVVGRLGPERSQLVRLLTSLLLPDDTLIRAEGFLRSRAGNHLCEVEGKDVTFRDNFSQLLMWELTEMEELVYLNWPANPSEPSSPSSPIDTISNPDSGVEFDDSFSESSHKLKSFNSTPFWNYFSSQPILTTSTFPEDADTTSIAYLSLPAQYLSSVAPPSEVMAAMAANTSADGIIQVYFTPSRPRTCPVVCINILRFFNKFSPTAIEGDDRLKATVELVINSLANRAYIYGSRYYIPEAFLYFATLLHEECKETSPAVWGRLDEHMKTALVEMLRVPAAGNAAALAMRVRMCQVSGLGKDVFKADFEELLGLQKAEDGGWPAGGFCKIGRTGDMVGNRGLTTGMVWRVLKDW
ncbi:HAD-like domain-containing protein [Triangularia verruculosa]|uniref:HAD-like domain-containing protein n=1 Tax=Triangularia verruculosa TaxID=2587418 RepID=A0AAN7AZ60_9PEZI|nr:HAD-like domain-containing protein [Triangularia verruculosa]